MTTPQTGRHQDDRPMVEAMHLVHRMLRREFHLIPKLVRRVGDDDRHRAEVLGRHARLLLTILHAHHDSEDAVLWPRILERVAVAAPLIQTMQRQHEVVAEAGHRTHRLLETWIDRLSAMTADDLAQAVEDLYASLVEHLELEEREVLPLVEKHVTGAEWREMEEHAREGIDETMLPIVLGMSLEDAPAGEREMLLALMPPEVREFVETRGQDVYDRYVAEVRNG